MPSPIRSLPAIALVAALGSLAQAAAADGVIGKPVFRLAPVVWYATLDGEWRFDDGPVDGTHVTSEDVGADDYQAGAFIEGNIGLPWIMDLEFGGFYFATDGEKVLGNDVQFGEAFFNEGELVKSDATLMDGYAGISFRIIDTPMGWFSAGAVAHYMSGEVTMEGGDKGTESGDAPAAAITARGAVSVIPTVTIGGGIQWVSIDIAEAGIDILDVQAYVEWKPLAAVGVIGGYRMLDYEIAIKDNDENKQLDINIAGPFAGVVVSF